MDVILEGMAVELHDALRARGLDTKHPPTDSKPPTDRIWSEYKKRGGTEQTDKDELARAVVKRVTEL